MTEEVETDLLKRLLEIGHAAVAEKDGGPSDKTILYHFTDTEAFRSIIQNQELWFSLPTTSNDPSEMSYGVGLACRILQDRLAMRKSPFDQLALSFLQDQSLVPKDINFEHFPLTVSFCGTKDTSGQWMHYGRNGRGVAIGFSSEIEKVTGYSLCEIDYSTQSQVARLTSVIDKLEKAVVAANASNPVNQKIWIGAANIAAISVKGLAVRMKHPSFVAENEWRLSAFQMWYESQEVTGPDSSRRGSAAQTLFRISEGRLIPYEKVSFRSKTQNLIEEVVLGYSSELSVDAVRMFLLSAEVTCPIIRSDVPVR
jgi:Protein of unknown function (DUF2971)